MNTVTHIYGDPDRIEAGIRVHAQATGDKHDMVALQIDFCRAIGEYHGVSVNLNHDDLPKLRAFARQLLDEVDKAEEIIAALPQVIEEVA